MRILDQSWLAKRPLSENCRWRYGLLVEDIRVEGFSCESYGFLVADDQTGEEARCRHVTLSTVQAVALLEQLIRCEVSPVHLRDIVEDWLGR